MRAGKKGLLWPEKWTQGLELLEMMEDFPSIDKLGMAVSSQRVGRRGDWSELRPGGVCVIKETLIVVLEGGT